MSRVSDFFSESEFKRWEKTLILFAVALFSVSFYLYLTNYPLKLYFFNLDDEGHGRPVGNVTVKKGGLRRQFLGEAEFKSLDLEAPLYDEDTVVTGTDSSATLKIGEDDSIELAPNTMVRLHFQTHLTLGGISRAAVVDVVAGSVQPVEEPHLSGLSRSRSKLTVRAPERPVVLPKLAVAGTPPVALPKPQAGVAPVSKPTASPVPVPTVEPPLIKELVLVAPRAGTELALDKGTQLPEKPVSFNWRVSPPDRPVQITLWKLESRSAGTKRNSIYKEVIADKAGAGEAHLVLKEPGLYRWELRGAKGEEIRGGGKTEADFVLAPDFETIETLEPLVGGEIASSNVLTGKLSKNLDITLRWKPYPWARVYHVTVKTSVDAKRPAFETQVGQPQAVFDKNQVLGAQIFYEISSQLPNGFIAHSPVQPFLFTFLAPQAALPRNHTRISHEKFVEDDESLLMTWQKTNFTEWYEIEISTDAEFKNVGIKRRLSENFLVFKPPGPGKYYWRVRSSSKKIISPFSKAVDLEIMP